jgi:TolB-like protein/Flp pilus assembly protein TadD
MTPEDWRRVKGILDEALPLEGAEREAFLARACGGNAELLAECRELIAADAGSWPLLDESRPPVSVSGVLLEPRGLRAGDRLGAYEILEEIGHGGMGTVYLGRRADEAFQKKVAIKVVRGGMDTEAVLRRFRTERQILASLEHPHIARLLDGGATAEGRPYFVMERIEGSPLPEWCAGKGLGVRERPRIFLEVCAAAEYAHRNHVVHRDIKPANILVTADGTAKLLDFGIAKLILPERFGAAPEETGTLFQLLTPDYASPEQVRGEAVTPASDVYALGVVLYELLTGRRPYDAGSSPAEMVRVVCEAEPPRPSQNATRPLAKELTGDLDTIVLKALRKEPPRRYASAGGIAEDIQRFLDGRPVLARPDTVGYRARRFARRHWAGSAAAAIAAISILAGVVAVRRAPPAPASATTALAVLPFRPLASEGRDDVLEQGMADTLIAKLSGVPGISVRPLGAVIPYARDGTDARQAGRRLRADNVVEGSVQRTGERIRVDARLVRVADGRPLWSETFDTDYAQVFEVQDAIVQRVAETLAPGLGQDARQRLAKPGTRSLAAYRAYLRGRYFWNRRTEEDFRKAIEAFEQAIAADPEYALAYSGLADCHSLLGVWGAGPASETHRLAQAAARQAVERADAPAEAHTSAGMVRWIYDWDWDGAEAEFRRAIDLNPGYATAHQWRAYALASRGRFDEAIASAERAQALDPLSLSLMTDLGEIHMWAGDYDRAIGYIREALELEPNFALAHNMLGMTYLKQGRPQDAVPELERAAQLEDRPRMLTTLGYGYGAAGRTEDALRIRTRLEELSKTRYISPFSLAVVDTGMGRVDSALDQLERGYDEHSDTMAILRTYPLFQSLRSDPRYTHLVRRVDEWKTAGSTMVP